MSIMSRRHSASSSAKTNNTGGKDIFGKKSKDTGGKEKEDHRKEKESEIEGGGAPEKTAAGKESAVEETTAVPESKPAEPEKKAETLEEVRDRLLRLQAEFINFRNRAEKDKGEFLKFANAELMREFVPVVDHFERAVESAEKNSDFDSLLAGIKITLDDLEKTLKKQGLEKMDCRGEIFDPNRHEAVMEILTEEYPENTVVEELQKGYLLQGKVIRPASVKVAKAPNESTT